MLGVSEDMCLKLGLCQNGNKLQYDNIPATTYYDME